MLGKTLMLAVGGFVGATQLLDFGAHGTPLAAWPGPGIPTFTQPARLPEAPPAMGGNRIGAGVPVVRPMPIRACIRWSLTGQSCRAWR